MSKIVDVHNLVKKYRRSETAAVDGISFCVEEGKFVTLLGPNGAGKTTTISILTTTLQKTSGEVTVAGFDVDKEQTKVRKKIGIIFQSPSLDGNLTAEENIRFHACLYGLYTFMPSYGMMEEKYRKKVEKLGELLGIGRQMFKPIKTFSGGMKRKLEIVRSLIHNPKVLFLDEPTTGLDPASRRTLWKYLREIRREEKTTIFLTTHYLEEAEEADQVYIINKGRIVAEGTPRQLKDRLVTRYVEMQAADDGRLAKELEKLKLPYERDGVVKVFVKDEEMQEVMRKIKTPLKSIRTHTPTLEDAYLDIIGGENEGS